MTNILNDRQTDRQLIVKIVEVNYLWHCVIIIIITYVIYSWIYRIKKKKKIFSDTFSSFILHVSINFTFIFFHDKLIKTNRFDIFVRYFLSLSLLFLFSFCFITISLISIADIEIFIQISKLMLLLLLLLLLLTLCRYTPILFVLGNWTICPGK